MSIPVFLLSLQAGIFFIKPVLKEMVLEDFDVVIGSEEHVRYAEDIVREMAESAKMRGTGIAKRTPQYVADKIYEGKAVVAFHRETGEWAGFTYIECWGHGKYVANSGLIINPRFRMIGLAKAIKTKAFFLSLKLFPGAKLFGLTTGLAVMKINSQLGYRPVPFSELTDDDVFWNGCQSCVNYPILVSKERRNCLCTAMLFDPEVDKVQTAMKAGELFSIMDEMSKVKPKKN